MPNPFYEKQLNGNEEKEKKKWIVNDMDTIIGI